MLSGRSDLRGMLCCFSGICNYCLREGSESSELLDCRCKILKKLREAGGRALEKLETITSSHSQEAGVKARIEPKA